MDGKGKFKAVLVAAAVLAMLGGAAAVKLGWVGELGSFAFGMLPMLMMMVVTGPVQRKWHGNVQWWLAPILGGLGTWLVLEARHPGLGYLDATWQSPVIGILGPILVAVCTVVAAFMTLVSRDKAYDTIVGSLNRLRYRLGMGGTKDGFQRSTRGYNDEALSPERIAEILPAVDSEGEPRQGFVLGVACDSYDEVTRGKLVGIPDGDEIVCPFTGEPIINDQGKPMRRVRKGTARAPLLVMCPVKQDGQILICGASGGGKTTGFVIPSVLNYPHSVVVGDPKLEILRNTLRALKAAGKNVHWLAPKRRDSSSFDVLSPYGLLDLDILTKVSALWATMIETKDEKGGGQFYKDSVRRVGEGATLKFFYEWLLDVKKWLETGKDLGLVSDVDALLANADFLDGWLRFGVVKRLHTISDRNDPLKRAWFAMYGSRYVFRGLIFEKVDTDEGNEWLRAAPFRPTLDTVVRWMKGESEVVKAELNAAKTRAKALVDAAAKVGKTPNPVFASMEAAFSGWDDPAPETWSNFSTSVGTDLKFMNDPAVAGLLCAKTRKVFVPEEILDDNTVVFIGINSSTIKSNPAAVKLIYAAIAYSIDNMPGGMLPQGSTLGMIFDEVQQLGKFDLLHDTWLPEGRGKGLRIMAIAQDPTAFDQAAGEGTFDKWCGIAKAMAVFGIGDPKNAERISKMSGNFNAIVTNESGQTGAVVGIDGGPAQVSSQLQEKPVFTVGQVMNLPEQMLFLFIKGKGCALVSKAFYYCRPEFEGLVNSNTLPDIALPDLEARYAGVWLPEVAGLLDSSGTEGDMRDEPVKDVRIESVVVGKPEENKAATSARRKEFLRMGGKWHGKPSDPAGYWYIPAYTDFTPFREAGWVKGLPPQKGQVASPEAEASGDAPAGRATHGVRSAKIGGGGRMCPQCGARMERRRDHRNGSDYLKCASCPCLLNPDGTPRGEAAAADAFARLRTTISSDLLAEAAAIVDRGFGSEAALGTVADARATDDADGLGGESAEREDGGEEESPTRVEAEPVAAAPADVDKEKRAMLALIDEL